MMRRIVLISCATLLVWWVCGCDKVLNLSDYSVDTETELPFDTATEKGRDYWVDGYCPLVESGDPQPVSGVCNNVGREGCCDEMGRVVYCRLGKLMCLPCQAVDYACSWQPESNGYYCTEEFLGADPGGAPMACADLAPAPPLVKFCNTLNADQLPQALTGDNIALDVRLVLTIGEAAPIEIFARAGSCGDPGCVEVPVGEPVTVAAYWVGGLLDGTLIEEVPMEPVKPGSRTLFATHVDGLTVNIWHRDTQADGLADRSCEELDAAFASSLK